MLARPLRSHVPAVTGKALHIPKLVSNVGNTPFGCQLTLHELTPFALEVTHDDRDNVPPSAENDTNVPAGTG